MRLSTPLKMPQGRPLRILLYARYSTEEQDKSSIDDQFLACRKFLIELGIVDAQIEELSDPENSGERVNRPGIDLVRTGIQKRCWDLVIAEDSSRLFRNCPACLQLVGAAVDNGIRALLPGDDVDTEDENWEQDLIDAQAHHCRSNSYTRKRIKRKHDGLWDSGAAIGMIKPGYVRRPTQPATEREPAAGPFYDTIDERWKSAICETYERIARLDPPWLVAKWLTQTGLPKSSNAKTNEWSDRNVVELIRRKIYKGIEEYRKTVAKKVHGTGRSKQVRNEPHQVKTRSMEHLRIVPDDLWDRANTAIDQRATNHDTPRGLDHPLAGVPRDSRGPLSNVLFCGACKSKMHALGRSEGGYRCKNSKSSKCWNRATSLRNLTHEKIAERVVAEFLSVAGNLDALCRHIERLFENDQPIQQRIKELSAEIRDDTDKRDRLLNLIESGGVTSLSPVGEPAAVPDSIVERIQQREDSIRQKRSELASLQRELGAARQIPSRESIEQRIRDQASRLLKMDREAGFVLQQLLDGPIWAVPYQQFGSNKVVLRAEFKLRVVMLLPDELFHLLERTHVSLNDPPVEVRTIIVDLFKPSRVPQHAYKAFLLRQSGKSVKQICAELGITKRIAHQAINLGEKMQEAGLSDPYIRLTEPPASASRWGARKQNRDDNPGRVMCGDPSGHPHAA